MTACNPANERVKREYFQWCEQARGLSPVTVGHAGRAIRAYELFTGHKCFKTFTDKQAIAFCQHLANDPSAATGKQLSISTRNSTLVTVRAFFRWIGSRPGYRQAIRGGDVDYLSVNRREQSIAQHRKPPKPFPSCDQIVQVLRNHPTATDLDKRDQALIAFLLLTCARVASIASLKLKHIDIAEGVAFLKAAEVDTKKSKTFRIWFFPVDPMVRDIVVSWVTYLRDDLGFSDDDPLFPSTAQIVGANMQFTNNGLSRDHWTTTDPIRAIVKKRLTNAGQPYFNPHLFRKTLAQLGEQRCHTPEEFKAWSQNMAHDEVMTTFTSYGEVPEVRQGTIIKRLGTVENDDGDKAAKKRMLRKMLQELDEE